MAIFPQAARWGDLLVALSIPCAGTLFSWTLIPFIFRVFPVPCFFY